MTLMEFFHDDAISIASIVYRVIPFLALALIALRVAWLSPFGKAGKTFL